MFEETKVVDLRVFARHFGPLSFLNRVSRFHCKLNCLLKLGIFSLVMVWLAALLIASHFNNKLETFF